MRIRRDRRYRLILIDLDKMLDNFRFIGWLFYLDIASLDDGYFLVTVVSNCGYYWPGPGVASIGSLNRFVVDLKIANGLGTYKILMSYVALETTTLSAAFCGSISY